MSAIRTFEEIGPDDVHLVGGKGLSLGLMARAGLPVPPGFCLTTRAYQTHHPRSPAASPLLADAVTAAYRSLGSGVVAVRSSATAEDGAVTSFAGQQETFLGVTGESAVLDAVAQCWASLDTARAVAYRSRQGVAANELAMAVVVQRLVPAEVAGVLFTRDPLDPAEQRMLVEAAWGLGEGVVSGRVTPDRFHLDRATGAVLERHLSMKMIQARTAEPGTYAHNAGVHPDSVPSPQSSVLSPQYVPVPADQQDIPCLTDAQLAELADLGRRVEAFYGAPRDVEWAWAEGRFWLLQARPITAATAAEREQVRREEIDALIQKAEPGGTVWSHYNLAEVLPAPTPMTWAIVKQLMSGRGGVGLMHRDLGFDPDPALDEQGTFDLVCGRPYCNLSRQLRLQFRQPPLEYPFATLKQSPAKALYPQPVANPANAGLRFWLLLPWISLRLAFRIARLRRTLPQQLREEIFPAFTSAVVEEAAVDLSRLDTAALLERLERWIQRVLYDFARDSVKPTALAGMVLEELEQKLVRLVGPEKAREAVGQIVMGVRPDPEADLPAAVCDLSAGRLSQEEFLRRFGHRGNQEMELSQPRWAEEPPARFRLPVTVAPGRSESLPTLPEQHQKAIRPIVEKLHTFLALRETGKHYLMKGYALLRRILLELDQRFGLQGGIFYLTPEELPALAAGKDLTTLIADRRRRRQIQLSLEVPQVLFSDDLQAIGRPLEVNGADTFQGVPLSAGAADGPALVLTEPRMELAPEEPFILVCPSTDPAWVPLFVRAKGLIMETGGVLSHGAIVAREFGLPAVAGIPGITRSLHTGQRVRVDGTTGRVALLG